MDEKILELYNQMSELIKKKISENNLEKIDETLCDMANTLAIITLFIDINGLSEELYLFMEKFSKEQGIKAKIIPLKL
jgi:hypothetical protein